MNAGTDRVFDLAQLDRTCAMCGMRGLCLPDGIGAEDMRRLDALIREKKPLLAGQTLYHAGSAMRTLYLLRAGSLMSTMVDADGTPMVHAFYLPGEVAGLDGLHERRHRCTVVALERSRVCELPLHEIQNLACRIPDLKEWFLDLLGHESDQDHEHLAIMNKRRADERLAAFLLGLARRYRRLKRDHNTLSLTMSRKDLACYLGLAEETVSRLFTRFQERGLLEAKRKTIRIRDFATLSGLCRGELSPVEEKMSA